MLIYISSGDEDFDFRLTKRNIKNPPSLVRFDTLVHAKLK